RSLEVHRPEEPVPRGLPPDEEQVPVTGDPHGDPVGLLEPQDHRDAGLREADVHLARELLAEPSRTGAGRPATDRVLTVYQEHRTGARGGEVVRGRTPDDAGADHDDVGAGWELTGGHHGA